MNCLLPSKDFSSANYSCARRGIGSKFEGKVTLSARVRSPIKRNDEVENSNAYTEEGYSSCSSL